MSYKLIIVEDEKIIRESLQSLEWSKINVEVVATFSNGLDAIQYLRNYIADVALVDIRMPVMDGMEFARTVQEEQIPLSIVCLSGYSDYAYLRECMKQGVKDFLLKPIDQQELFKTISSLVPKEDEKLEYPHHYIVHRVLQFVEANYKQTIKLVDVAEHVHLNPIYLSRVFKQQMGVGFVDYLTDYRIQKAITLMENTTMNINQIAMEVGFFSSRYFAEVFKKRKGMTPSEYRNR